MSNETKYTVHFKNSDGSHHSTKTMNLDGYIHLLQEVNNHIRRSNEDHSYKYNYPTIHFEVEKREIIYSTFHA